MNLILIDFFSNFFPRNIMLFPNINFTNSYKIKIISVELKFEFYITHIIKVIFCALII